MKVKALVCEFIGVFALCWVGINAIHHFGAIPGGLIGIALAHGLVIACFASAFGAISGGHFNPAVTLAMLVTKRIDPAGAAGYIFAQILGGWVASLACGLVPAVSVAGGTPALGEGVSLVSGIILEAIATGFLVWVIYGTAIDSRAPKLGATAIGFAVIFAIFAIGPFTGAALNPARYLGPALAGGSWANALVWVIGPIIGAVLAALLYENLLIKSDD